MSRFRTFFSLPAKTVLAAAAAQFLALTTYYLLRPLRETIGAQDGGAHLPWLFSASFGVMLIVGPLLGYICTRYPRRTWLPLLFHGATLCLLAFFVAWKFELAPTVARASFYVWTSLFGLLIVSILWSVLSDHATREQATRRFGPIAAGSSLGALCGPLISRTIAQYGSPAWLFVASALGLQLALVLILRVDREKSTKEDCSPRELPLVGSWWSGILHVVSDPRLRSIAIYVFCLTSSSTIFYFVQAKIVGSSFVDEADRLAFFANIDFFAGLISLLLQLGAAGAFVARWGRGRVLIALPAVSFLGLGALALAPGATALSIVQVLRRAAQYGVAKPVREMLYTDVPAQDRYRAKSVIDLVVYRGGDVVSAWLFEPAMGWLGTWVAVSTAPLFAFLPLLAFWGHSTTQLRRTDVHSDDSTNAPPTP